MALIMSVFYGIMFVLTPFSADDLWYYPDNMPLSARGSLDCFLALIDVGKEHLTHDVGRFPTLAIALFMGLFPEWVYTVVYVVAVWVIYMAAAKLCRFDYFSLLSALWILVVTVVFPWMDFMFTLVYSINYVIPLALDLVLLIILRNASSEKWCLAKSIAVTMLAFLCGWWHEGFSVPLLCGLAVYFLILRRWPNRNEWMIAIGLAFGIMTLMSMPAFRASTHQRFSNLLKSTLWESLINVVAFNCLTYLYIVLWIIACCVRKIRHRILANRHDCAFMTCLLVFGIVATAIYFAYFNGPRTGAYPQIMSALGLLILLPYFTKNRNICKNAEPIRGNRCVVSDTLKSGYMAVGIAFALTCVNMAWSIAVQRKLTYEYDEVMRLKASNGNNPLRPVFFNQTRLKIGPDLLKPSYLLLNSYYGLYGCLLLPKELEDFDVNGTGNRPTSVPGLFIHDNMLVSNENLENKRLDLIVEYSDGKQIMSRSRSYVFETSNGDTCTYISLHEQTMGNNHQIKAVKLHGITTAVH